MGTFVLILAILAYVASWIPFLGFPITIVCSIIALVISSKKMKVLTGRQNICYIIASIISMFAILMIIFMSGIYVSLRFDEYSYKKERSALEAKIKTFEQYEKNDEVAIGRDYLVIVKEFDQDGDTYYLSIDVEGLRDYAYYSMYDLALYDGISEELFYPSYLGDNESFRFGRLDEGDKEESMISYIVPDNLERELYLVYVDNENGVKIKL